MILKYAIALAILLILAAFAAWAFLPARYLARPPGPAPADPAAPAAAPGQGLRPPLQPVAALGAPGGAAPFEPDPGLPADLVADPGPGRALGVPRAGALPARAVPFIGNQRYQKLLNARRDTWAA